MDERLGLVVEEDETLRYLHGAGNPLLEAQARRRVLELVLEVAVPHVRVDKAGVGWMVVRVGQDLDDGRVDQSGKLSNLRHSF